MRKLKGGWKFETTQELQAVHGVDTMLVDEVITGMVEQRADEIRADPPPDEMDEFNALVGAETRNGRTQRLLSIPIAEPKALRKKPPRAPLAYLVGSENNAKAVSGG